MNLPVNSSRNLSLQYQRSFLTILELHISTSWDLDNLKSWLEICKHQNYHRGAYSSSGAQSISYGKVDQDNEITNPKSPVSYLLEVFLTPMNVFYKMM